MRAKNFSFDEYLLRIGFQGRIRASIETVTTLMRDQLFSVPFENLDVQAGKVVSLVPEDIVEKIVNRRRGGYCYELNALFAMALHELGIPCQMLMARPMIYPEKRPKTHMVLKFQVDGQSWMCDLGFGGHGIRQPLALTALDTPIMQVDDIFLLTAINDDEYVVKAKIDGEWRDQYSFDLVAQQWIDFVPANWLNSTHPETIFVKQLIVTLQTPSGRKTLAGNVLKIEDKGVITKQKVSPDQRAELLAREFGLTW